MLSLKLVYFQRQRNKLKQLTIGIGVGASCFIYLLNDFDKCMYENNPDEHLGKVFANYLLEHFEILCHYIRNLIQMMSVVLSHYDAFFD